MKNTRWGAVAPSLAGLMAVWLAWLLFVPPSVLPASAFGLRTPAEESPTGFLGPPENTSVITLPDTGLSEQERIVHLLNRIGFGPRPGDVERVKQMGIVAYIEQQLHPETIPDGYVEERLASFETLHMTAVELLATYPPPQLLRRIERRLSAQMDMDPEAAGTLFPELRRRRERRPGPREGEETNTPAREDDPVTRERRRFERMTPQERMERAMNSPARIVLELSQAKLLRAIYSERQLQEVMTDFWFNHFNVFIGKGADRWMTTSYERDAIRPHALGRFRDLLEATAKHPAMLFYLDNWLSADPNADYDPRTLRQRYAAYLREQGMQPGGVVVEILRQRGVDTTEIERRLARMGENSRRRRGRRGGRGRGQPPPPQQRRGLNENYARELLELHTLGVDGGYTQQDVIEVARCFTGWTMLPPQFGQQFIYVDEFHDKGTKVVLGHRIENSGQHDGERVLDILAQHPSTARFLSTKLARRFVSDAPPASLVDKMAATFRETGGDIRAVLRTMFSSEEFWAPEAVRAKVKTPFEFVVSAARATNAEVDNLPPGLVVVLRGLGQPLYAAQPPTGYKDTAEAWVSTGGLLGRMKVALGMAVNRLPGVHIELPPELGQAGSTDALVTILNQQVLGRPMSESTRTVLEAQLAKVGSEIPSGGRQAEARLALGWLLASPEFQRR